MSEYQFFASDCKLDEYDNGIITFDGKKLEGLNRADRCITDFDERYAMRIIHEDDMTEASRYTDKKYCAYIEWYYCTFNAEAMIEYIKKHLQNSRQIELWDVWMGEKSSPQIKKCRSEDVRITTIKEIWGKDHYEKPECLLIYVSDRQDPFKC